MLPIVNFIMLAKTRMRTSKDVSTSLLFSMDVKSEHSVILLARNVSPSAKAGFDFIFNPFFMIPFKTEIKRFNRRRKYASVCQCFYDVVISP